MSKDKDLEPRLNTAEEKINRHGERIAALEGRLAASPEEKKSPVTLVSALITPSQRVPDTLLEYAALTQKKAELTPGAALASFASGGFEFFYRSIAYNPKDLGNLRSKGKFLPF